jgi:transporter family-2 protein
LQASGVLIAIGWAVWSRTWPQITEVAREWWWIPLGVLGWGIVAALGFSAARMGASSTLAIVIASQLIAALLLDRLVGRIEISFQAAAGALVLIFGVLLVTSSARSTL